MLVSGRNDFQCLFLSEEDVTVVTCHFWQSNFWRRAAETAKCVACHAWTAVTVTHACTVRCVLYYTVQNACNWVDERWQLCSCSMRICCWTEILWTYRLWSGRAAALMKLGWLATPRQNTVCMHGLVEHSPNFLFPTGPADSSASTLSAPAIMLTWWEDLSVVYYYSNSVVPYLLVRAWFFIKIILWICGNYELWQGLVCI